MRRNGNAQHIDFNPINHTSSQQLKHLLRFDYRKCFTALDSLDRIREELYLAFTLPCYESQTKKNLQASLFFELLLLQIKKEILLLTLFIFAQKKLFAGIFERISEKEFHQNRINSIVFGSKASAVLLDKFGVLASYKQSQPPIQNPVLNNCNNQLEIPSKSNKEIHAKMFSKTL